MSDSKSADKIDYRFGMTLAEVERRVILSVWEETGKNRRRSANVLGITVRTLDRKLADFGEMDSQLRPAAAPTRPPDKLAPEQMHALALWARQEEPWALRSLPRHIAACLDHFRSKGGLKVDWEATVRNWVRKQRSIEGRPALPATAHRARPRGTPDPKALAQLDELTDKLNSKMEMPK